MKHNISDIRITLIEPKKGLIAFARCVIDNKIVIDSIGIHQKKGKNEYRLTYAQKNQKTIAYPITKELSKAIESAIFLELKNVFFKNRNNDDRYSCT